MTTITRRFTPRKSRQIRQANEERIKKDEQAKRPTPPPPLGKRDGKAYLQGVLRPSASPRWLSCTAYARLMLEWRPERRPSSRAAQEGTRLHAHMENIIKHGEPLPRVGSLHIEALRDAWRLWDDGIRERSDVWHTELAVVLPLAIDIQGTADLVGYDAETKTMILIDWKFGRRYTVLASSPQLTIYGAGAYMALKDQHDIEHIEMHIIQPRMENPPLKDTRTLTVDELREEVREISGTVYAIVSGDDKTLTFRPQASNCMWCDVAERCEAKAKAEATHRKLEHATYAELLGDVCFDKPAFEDKKS